MSDSRLRVEYFECLSRFVGTRGRIIQPKVAVCQVGTTNSSVLVVGRHNFVSAIGIED